jgi:hypothetical protein
MSRRFHSLTFLAVALALVAAPVLAAGKKMSEAKPSGIPVGKPVLQSSVGTHKAPGGGPITFYTSKAAFDAAHPGLPCEDYQDFINALVGCDGPANSTTSCPGGYAVGAIAAGLEISCGTNCTGVPGNNGLVVIPSNFDGNPTIIFGSNYFIDSTVVRLTGVPAPSALGLEISCHFGSPSVTVNVFDSLGTQVGSTSSPCANAGTFLGMDSSAPEGLGHITIDDGTGASVESTDNVCFGDPVPVELQDFFIND